MRNKIWLICVLSLLISSCSPGAQTESVQTNPPQVESTATEINVPTPRQTATPEPTDEPTFMDRPSPEDIRLFDYNVNWDSIFPDNDPQNHPWRTVELVDAFRRLIKAVSPDIACIQEINPARDPDQVAEIFNETIPLEGGAQWQAISARDMVIVSKYDLKTEGYEMQAPSADPEFIQAAALVDLPDGQYAKDMYVMCGHFRSSGSSQDIREREYQGDVIARQIGDMKTPGDYIDLEAGTPFILSGDFNVYETDDHRQLNTLITGDIVYENRFGHDVSPDWDETPLTDVYPSHQGRGTNYWTWRDDPTGFSPFALDRVIYTDSVMTVSNSFILDTTSMSLKDLVNYGLLENDVTIDPDAYVYDHLPIVVDFSLVN